MNPRTDTLALNIYFIHVKPTHVTEQAIPTYSMQCKHNTIEEHIYTNFDCGLTLDAVLIIGLYFTTMYELIRRNSKSNTLVTSQVGVFT